MKRLNELLDCNYDTEITGIKMNSKEIVPGDLFVCTMGVKVDRHDYIDDAIKRGAVALVVSKDIKDVDIPIVKVEDTNKILPIICAKFYDNPEKELTIIGVTGTDGKTSVSTIAQTLIGNDDCGYMGTNGRSCSKFTKDIANTTPDSDKLFEYFRDFVSAGCTKVVMEASSEAFFRKRLETISYDVAAITNITREHLNIHGSFENYIECKCQLFKQVKPGGYCILNKDDEFYETVKAVCTEKVLTYGLSKDCDMYIKNYTIEPHKTKITFVYENTEYNITSPLLGKFNIYNLAAGILIALTQGKTMDEIIPNIEKIKISGRLDMVDLGQNFYVMIDYAHTPNGISNLLEFVHTLDINRSIVVIGSAGERDYLKRPIMGKTVCDNASYAIFTYEDPRSEDPRDIIDMLVSDIKDTHDNYEIVVDRHEAIEKAINIAKEKDMVLILGKGNETYQKLKTETIYFNDIEEAKKALEKRLEREKVVS